MCMIHLLIPLLQAPSIKEAMGVNTDSVSLLRQCIFVCALEQEWLLHIGGDNKELKPTAR